jgi:hypothetical protein
VRLYQPIFVGRRGDQQVSFVGFAGEGFAILVDGNVVHTGPTNAVDEGVELFLAMIARPTPGGSPLPVPDRLPLLSA